MIFSLMPADDMSRYRRPMFPVFTNHKFRAYFFQTTNPEKTTAPTQRFRTTLTAGVAKMIRLRYLQRLEYRIGGVREELR